MCACVTFFYLLHQVGTIIELLTARKGDLLEVDQVDQGFGAAVQDSTTAGDSKDPASAGGSSSGSSSGSNRQRLVFEVPARGMIGFKSLFASITRGEGLMQRAFARYAHHCDSTHSHILLLVLSRHGLAC
jgi:translation elongation factor EF-G